MSGQSIAHKTSKEVDQGLANLWRFDAFSEGNIDCFRGDPESSLP